MPIVRILEKPFRNCHLSRGEIVLKRLLGTIERRISGKAGKGLPAGAARRPGPLGADPKNA